MQRIPEPEYMDLTDEAEAYANADFSEVNEAFVECLLDCAPDASAPLALDLGVGPGDIPARILGRRPRWRIVGLDAAPAMMAAARARAPENGLILVLADAKRLPFGNGAFDMVLSNSILHHINDTQLFWRELARVAKPGALVLLRDLLRPAAPEEAGRIVHRYAGGESALLQEEFYRSLLAAYTLEEVSAQLAQAGLPALAVRQVTDRHLDVYGRIQHA